MSLPCSLANFSRILCQEAEEEKQDFFFKKSQELMQKLITKKMISTGIQEIGVIQSDIKPFF